MAKGEKNFFHIKLSVHLPEVEDDEKGWKMICEGGIIETKAIYERWLKTFRVFFFSVKCSWIHKGTNHAHIIINKNLQISLFPFTQNRIIKFEKSSQVLFDILDGRVILFIFVAKRNLIFIQDGAVLLRDKKLVASYSKT